MAENEQERTSTEMASQQINAMNPNTLETRNAAAGGMPDLDEAVDAMQDGAGQAGDAMQQAGRQAGDTMQSVGQQAMNATMNLVNRARDFAVEFSESLWGGNKKEDKNKI